tara:strand:+ start:1379 stop:2305 length:927 start_codon:yes stop_codon:yes gene_type:complete
MMPQVNDSKSEIVPRLQGLHLFHFDGAPCAQRVRFVLGEKNLQRGREVKFDSVSPDTLAAATGTWISRSVSLIKKQNMSAEYARIHPDMVVPALAHDGRLYLESMDIIEYLDQAFGGPAFIPSDPGKRQETLALVEQAKELHLSLRYVSFRWSLGRLAMLSAKEQANLKQLAQGGNDRENLVAFYEAFSNKGIPQQVFDEHLLELHKALSVLNQKLGDGRNYLTGDILTMADVFWAMKLLRLIETGYLVSEHHPLLFAWYERIYRRPAFQQEVMLRNRLLNRVWRSKAAVERMLGLGLDPALKHLLAA